MFTYYWGFLLFLTIPLFSDISYAGMTIQCNQGCGDLDGDPDMETIGSIYDHSIIKGVFQGEMFALLNDEFDKEYVAPWEIWGDDEPDSIEIYDWERSNGRFGGTYQYKHLWICSYESHLKAINEF